MVLLVRDRAAAPGAGHRLTGQSGCAHQSVSAVARSGARQPRQHLSRWLPRRRFRSGATVRKDAELVPLWVGKYNPAHIALADVGVSSTKVEQATDLFVLLPIGWVDVEVEPVLDGLAFGHVRECQRRWHRAKAVLAFRHHGGTDRDGSVVFVLHLVVKDPLRPRTTTYGEVPAERQAAAAASDGVCTSVRSGLPLLTH